MLHTKGYAAMSAGAALEPFSFNRRAVGPHDVLIQIQYCGICHSDIHQARDEWGGSFFPMVPGHEIVGTAIQIGGEVKKFKQGDRVGVGCFVDSCRRCGACQVGLEQYCEAGMILTYNGLDKQGAPTYGGYSKQIVVDENYLLRVPSSLSLEGTAPLLCAGITTYSPLKHWGVGKGHRLGVVGLGGLGHMAVKIGWALGAEVTVFSRSERKRQDAYRLGAVDFVSTEKDGALSEQSGKFDFVIDTVSASHDYNAYLDLLTRDGTMILVGAPSEPLPVAAFHLVLKRRRMVGSLIGGISETQEMLEFCAKHQIPSDVEVIPFQQVNEAYERILKGDVRFRFVIDVESLG
ncbi:NAD(P)-dependent alcohol dehydrogenase [Candidatus Nitronereus thalassa]|uniref:NAD(P)-dependent alcohol dehydrogenase n=1 Tax=Candidatus Nitronereus thalassa TaxID=3020898 RepID=A0ABU3KC80_9BACT|nr:NAD(P)-dependent alcohol dehydrogenase [Candidatus Nitronereus thalassa]MDT7044125.1 NAD(P)-dependent alcohol dehydrogenase [Candidatus Nitronereus thalassa]